MWGRIVSICRQRVDDTRPRRYLAPMLDLPVSDRLFDQLAEAIVGGELAAGARISEPDLAARYGTSRAPLREAIRRLEERKLVSRIAHQGARVAVLSPARIAEIYTVREALEGIAAREAATRITAAELERLHAHLDAHSAMLDGEDSDDYRQGVADDDFHFVIIRASGNATLIDLLLDQYYALIRMFRKQHRQVAGRARRALFEHRRITDALADHDADLAELLMRRHIAAARAGIADALAHSATPNPLET
jgi:DNA-binding GntR family transcriptional regulator